MWAVLPGVQPGRQLHGALCFREELPTIYKCPYQGCTAVYRGADGMKVRKVLLKPGQESTGAGGGVRSRLTQGCCEPGEMEM